MASYKGLWSWVIARGRENTVSAAPGGGHTTFLFPVDNASGYNPEKFSYLVHTCYVKA